MRKWRKREPDWVAMRLRLPRSVIVAPNEVLVVFRDGELLDVHHAGKFKTRTWAEAFLSLFRLGPHLEGYIAHRNPIKLTYWLNDPDADDSPEGQSFTIPVLTKDRQPIVGRITL